MRWCGIRLAFSAVLTFEVFFSWWTVQSIHALDWSKTGDFLRGMGAGVFLMMLMVILNAANAGLVERMEKLR